MKTEIKVKPELEIIKKEQIPHLLFPGEVGAVLELIVKDKDGNVTERREMKSRSFVRQFLELLWILGYPINENLGYTLLDTSAPAVSRLIPPSVFVFSAVAAIANVANGIVIGTDIPHAAPTINDTKLVSQILHAVMNYSAMTFGAPGSDATTSQFTLTRDFTNVSGGAVLVAEIGLYVIGYRYATNYYFMVIRDVIGGGINVPNGQTLTVNYRIQAIVT